MSSAAAIDPRSTIATTSSTVGIDCQRNFAFVALRVLSSSTGHGLVKVLNIGVDPKTTDPRIETIDLGHADYPSGIAVDPVHKVAIVVSGNNGKGGFLDVIDESLNPPQLEAGGPFAFPLGSDTNSGDESFGAPGLGQVIYDPVRNVALVSTSDQADSPSDQCSSPGACTGIAVFQLGLNQFGPIVPFESGTKQGGADNFGFNPVTNQIFAPDDADEPIIQAVNETGTPTACTLSDANVLAENGNDGKPHADPDTIGVDTKTNIWVVGAGFGQNVKLPIINLNGAQFVNGTSCTVMEAGKQPNSVLLNSFTAGSLAVNSTTHQAFVAGLSSGTALSGNRVGLVSLPKKPVVQLKASMLKYVQTSIPNDPDGSSFRAQGFPYTAAIDVCHNNGYVADGGILTDPTYLVQISLAMLQHSAPKISTPLKSGTCWRNGSVSGCDNNKGVKFFPVTP